MGLGFFGESKTLAVIMLVLVGPANKAAHSLALRQILFLDHLILGIAPSVSAGWFQ